MTGVAPLAIALAISRAAVTPARRATNNPLRGVTTDHAAALLPRWAAGNPGQIFRGS